MSKATKRVFTDKILGRKRTVKFTMRSFQWLTDEAGVDPMKGMLEMSKMAKGENSELDFLSFLNTYTAMIYAGIISDSEDLENGFEDVLDLEPHEISEILSRGVITEAFTSSVTPPQDDTSGKKPKARKK